MITPRHCAPRGLRVTAPPSNVARDRFFNTMVLVMTINLAASMA
jgi:hypothetical protein